MPPCETPPILHLKKEVPIGSEEGQIGSFPISSSSAIVNLILPILYDHGASDENYLNFLLDGWVRLQEAYFVTLEIKQKDVGFYELRC
jgi:hypothetical protein